MLPSPMSDVGAKRYAVLEKQLQSSIQRFIDVMQEHDDVPEDVRSFLSFFLSKFLPTGV